MYITKGLTESSLVNVVVEFMALGRVDLLQRRGVLGGVGTGRTNAKDYVHYEPTIMLSWKTPTGAEKTAPIPYLQLESGGIITIARKGWQTRQTFMLQIQKVIAPYVEYARKAIYTELELLRMTLLPMPRPLHDEAPLNPAMQQVFGYLANQNLNAVLSFDNYKGHLGEMIDDLLHNLDITGAALLPNATKFIQIIDKIVNGPIKRDLVSRHGSDMMDQLDEHLHEMDVPAGVLADPEQAWSWTPPAEAKIQAPTRAKVIVWTEDVWTHRQSNAAFCASVKAGFSRYGQAPSFSDDGTARFVSFTEQERESVERNALLRRQTLSKKAAKATCTAEERVENERAEVSSMLAHAGAFHALNKGDFTEDICGSIDDIAPDECADECTDECFEVLPVE
jgi:hypothetical protein